jgi:RNA polymerase sigma-70 factor (ECF subfamily)
VSSESSVHFTDVELASNVLEGSPSAAGSEAELCRRFAPRVRAYGRRHLGSEDAACELTQRVLVVMLEKLRRRELRQTESIASFVLGTARHVALGMRRKDARLDPLTEADEPWHHPTPPASLDARRAATCLEELADRERAVVVLSVFEEQSAEEVAATLAVSAGNVRVLRHRALAALRECFERHPEAS